MGAILRKYGAATTIVFPLIDAGTLDFEDSPVTHAAGDTKICKDEGSWPSTTNAFAAELYGMYKIALTATEMEAARIIVVIIDQTSPKAWEDQAVLIETYGHASAQHAFDLDLAALTEAQINTQADLALSDANLDKFIAVKSTADDSVAAPTTFLIYSDLAEASDDHYNGMVIMFTSGALAGQSRAIKDYIAAAGIVVVDFPFTEAPVDGDEFIIFGCQEVSRIMDAIISVTTLATNVIQPSKIANGALTAAKFANDTEVFQAKVWIIDDDGGSNDRWMFSFFKNGAQITSGITGPTVWVYSAAASPADLVGTSGSPQALTEAGATETWFHNEGTNRIVDGVAYFARVRFTAEGSEREWTQPIGRDS